MGDQIEAYWSAQVATRVQPCLLAWRLPGSSVALAQEQLADSLYL